MTTKMKVAAYRLTGGSKTVYSADYEEKISLFNNFKKQIEKLISLVANLVTDNLATELKQKLTKDNVDSGMNKFEKVGQAFYKYSSQIENNSCASVLQTAKDVFNNAGQKHRLFRTNILEKVQKPMNEWIETNAKHVSKEMKSVNNKRDELDCAINKLRRKSDDTELQVMKEHAENTFKEELEKTDKLLDNEIKKSVRQNIFFLISLARKIQKSFTEEEYPCNISAISDFVCNDSTNGSDRRLQQKHEGDFQGVFPDTSVISKSGDVVPF